MNRQHAHPAQAEDFHAFLASRQRQQRRRIDWTVAATYAVCGVFLAAIWALAVIGFITVLG